MVLAKCRRDTTFCTEMRHASVLASRIIAFSLLSSCAVMGTHVDHEQVPSSGATAATVHASPNSTLNSAPSTESATQLALEEEGAGTVQRISLRRASEIRYAPNFASPALKVLPANSEVDWINAQRQGGFIRVSVPNGPTGWLWEQDSEHVGPAILSGFEAQAACANTLAQCPERGCATNDADVLFNTLKHNIHPAGPVKRLSFEDFAALQKLADQSVGERVHIPPDERASLSHLTLPSGTEVSEGDDVRVVAYLAASGTGPHPNLSGESVNCHLKGAANNDYHIPVTAAPNDTEFDGIVVEMIPQGRDEHSGWTISSLKRIRADQQQVWIEGNLFYDGEHQVNADESHKIGGQPARFSLWEIHPVTKFLVCHKSVCDPNTESDWAPL